MQTDQLWNLTRGSEAGLDIAEKIIRYVCKDKVSVELPKPPNLRELSDQALLMILTETVDGETEFNAITSRHLPPFDAAVFLETCGLRYWRGLCRRHAACCELLMRSQA